MGALKSEWFKPFHKTNTIAYKTHLSKQAKLPHNHTIPSLESFDGDERAVCNHRRGHSIVIEGHAVFALQEP